MLWPIRLVPSTYFFFNIINVKTRVVRFFAIQANNFICALFIPVTRRVKEHTRFVGKYVTGRRKRFRPHKVYIFLIRITSRVDLAMSVCLSVRMNGEISETVRARLLRFGVQIPALLTQRKFISAECHAHSNAHKPTKTG